MCDNGWDLFRPANCDHRNIIQYSDPLCSLLRIGACIQIHCYCRIFWNPFLALSLYLIQVKHSKMRNFCWDFLLWNETLSCPVLFLVVSFWWKICSLIVSFIRCKQWCLLSFQAAEECTSVLELDSNHSGALMLRAQTLVTLKEYHSALFDVNRLLELNPSSEVYQNLHARLKTQLVWCCSFHFSCMHYTR